jgi:5-methylcytosine-specific restriction enzyme subunit McrC
LKTIDLVEWQTLGPSEADFLKSINPSFDKKAQRIADELASGDRLEILQLRSGIQIRATSWVGRIVLGDLTVTVRPKINGTPLLCPASAPMRQIGRVEEGRISGSS